MTLKKKALEKTVGKEDNAGNQHFLLFLKAVVAGLASARPLFSAVFVLLTCGFTKSGHTSAPCSKSAKDFSVSSTYLWCKKKPNREVFSRRGSTVGCGYIMTNPKILCFVISLCWLTGMENCATQI